MKLRPAIALLALACSLASSAQTLTLTPMTASSCTPTATKTITILPLGDSLTEGYPAESEVQGGYRCPLYTLLNAAAINPIAEGYGANGAITCQNGWEGHIGYTIQQDQALLDSDRSVTIGKPQYILLMLGTNDIADGLISSIPAHMDALINDMVAQDPTVHIFLSTIPPMSTNFGSIISGWAAQVPTANSEIRAVASAYGSRVTLVDNYSSLLPNVNKYSYDGVHFLPAGYDAMAATWASAIENYLGVK